MVGVKVKSEYKRSMDRWHIQVADKYQHDMGFSMTLLKICSKSWSINCANFENLIIIIVAHTTQDFDTKKCICSILKFCIQIVCCVNNILLFHEIICNNALYCQDFFCFFAKEYFTLNLFRDLVLNVAEALRAEVVDVITDISLISFGLVPTTT